MAEVGSLVDKVAFVTGAANSSPELAALGTPWKAIVSTHGTHPEGAPGSEAHTDAVDARADPGSLGA